MIKSSKVSFRLNKEKHPPFGSQAMVCNNNITNKMKYFTYKWDTFHMSIWERAHRQHLERRRPLQKYLKGDWTNILSATFKTGQSDLETVTRASNRVKLPIGSFSLESQLTPPLAPNSFSTKGADWSVHFPTSWKQNRLKFGPTRL